MKAVFCTATDVGIETVGEVTLGADGHAYVTGNLQPDFLQSILAGIRPTGSYLVKPDRGEAFIRALPMAFHGSRFWAELRPDG